MVQLSLFDSSEFYEFPIDLLDYTEGFLSLEEAKKLEEKLLKSAPWKQNTQKMYDKTVVTPRLTAWYGDENTVYRLGGNSFNVNPWSEELLILKEKIENFSGFKFNSVLLNLYRDNNDSVAWHRDKDSALGDRPVIASISLGEVRNFDFREINNHQNKYSLPLSNGSLLIMKGDLQVNWEHRIAKSIKLMKSRINLTFRQIEEINF